MQTLEESFRNLLQLNEPKQPIKIPEDSIQVVPKKDDPIIVIPDTICIDGYKAVCCRKWWREFDASYTVFECWECTVLLVIPLRPHRCIVR